MQPDQQALVDQSHLGNMLAIEVKHPVADGVRLYGCRQGDISYCISFDDANPKDGWRASWQREGQKTTYLRRRFAKRDDAVLALRKVARRHAA